MGSIIEYKYSVNQLPSGDYQYFKWWYSGPVSRAKKGNPTKVPKPGMVPKGAGLVFITFTLFLDHRYEHLPFFDGLDLPYTRVLLFPQTGHL